MGSSHSVPDEEDLLRTTSFDTKSIKLMWKQWKQITNKKESLSQPEEIYDLIAKMGFEEMWTSPGRSVCLSSFTAYTNNELSIKEQKKEQRILTSNSRFKNLVGTSMLHFFDLSGKGAINFKDLLIGLAAIKAQDQTEVPSMIFQMMDTNRDGVILREELFDVIKNQLRMEAMNMTIRHWLPTFNQLWKPEKINEIIDVIFFLWEKPEIYKVAQKIYFKILCSEESSGQRSSTMTGSTEEKDEDEVANNDEGDEKTATSKKGGKKKAGQTVKKKEITVDDFKSFYRNAAKRKKLQDLTTKHLTPLILAHKELIDQRLIDYVQFNKPLLEDLAK